MKKCLLITLAALLPAASFAQSDSTRKVKPVYGSYTKGVSLITLNYGFLLPYGSEQFELNIIESISTHVGPVYFKYEYGLSNSVGLGVQLGVAPFWTKQDYLVGDQQIIGFHNIAATGHYHFGQLLQSDKTDVYITGGIGANVVAIYSPFTSDTKIAPIFRAGIRHYTGKNLALNADFGYDGLSLINLGVTFRTGKRRQEGISPTDRQLYIDKSDREESN